MSTSPYIVALAEYVRGVTSGSILACREVRQACQRHLNDLERSKGDWPYRFDEVKAHKACAFLEKLPHTKGEWARKDGVGRTQYIKLQPWQVFVIGSLYGWVNKETGMRRFRSASLYVPRKNGKALDIETPIATTSGWKRHGDLVAGDFVFSPSGKPVMVEAVTEHYEGPCMRVDFSGGRSIVAHENHEWETSRTWFTGRGRGFRDGRPLPVVETKQIANTLRGGSRGDYVHRIPNTESLDTSEPSLEIPPYVLGAWLGDGTSLASTIVFADQEIADRIRSLGVLCEPRYQKGAATMYFLGMGVKGSPVSSFKARLRRLGVYANKHIPDCYMFASADQRMEVLRGLIDTDGHVTKRGQIEITITNKRLAEDICSLAATLGMKATMSESDAMLNGVSVGLRYRISLFSISEGVYAYVPRKQANIKIIGGGKRRSTSRTVVGVVPCGIRTVNCIQVQGGLYLAGRDLIKTHNSIFGAGVGLRMFAFDGEPGAEVYSGATTEKQAWEVFRPARQIAKREPELVAARGIRIAAKALIREEDGSKFEPVIGKPGDGASPHCAIVDEYHEHQTDELCSTMVTGMGARKQPLLLILSTAGANLAGPCREDWKQCQKLLAGAYEDDTHFAIIYTVDDGDKWDSDAAMLKANPNYDVSVYGEFLRAQRDKAKQDPRAQAAYKTKHLNMWVTARAGMFNLQQWDAMRDDVSPHIYHGASCIGGMDMMYKHDLCAFVLAFPVEGGRFAVRGRYFLPRATIQLPQNQHYRAWVEAGHIIEAGENVIDHDIVRDEIARCRAEYQLEELDYDPAHTLGFISPLAADGLQCVDAYAGGRMPEHVRDFDALIRAGKIIHDGDPVLAWAISNCVPRKTRRGMDMLDKESPEQKIDPVVSLVMAIGGANRRAQEGGGMSGIYW